MTSSLLLSKINKFTNARNRGRKSRGTSHTNNHHEHRRELRRESNDKVFLQIVQCEEKDLVGTTLSSSALDASANGLKVACNQHIPAGSIIDFWVADSTRPGKFFLSSTVRWVNGDQNGSFKLGVELLDDAATDIHDWRLRQA